MCPTDRKLFIKIISVRDSMHVANIHTEIVHLSHDFDSGFLVPDDRLTHATNAFQVYDSL